MKELRGIYLAAILTILFITALTIGAERSKETKDWLKNTFTHHWVAKGVLSIIFFAIASVILYKLNLPQVNTVEIKTWSIATVLITLISILALVGYFYLHFTGAV